jgi:hypothetical protein
MRVSDEEAAALEAALASNPTMGEVIPGMSGIRKVRFGYGGRGKRGGGRAIYVAALADDMLAMLFAYAKNEQADLTPADRRKLLAMLEALANG